MSRPRCLWVSYRNDQKLVDKIRVRIRRRLCDKKKRHSKSRVPDGPIITNSEETLIEEAEREDDEADAGEGDEGGGEGSETQECI